MTWTNTEDKWPKEHTICKSLNLNQNWRNILLDNSLKMLNFQLQKVSNSWNAQELKPRLTYFYTISPSNRLITITQGYHTMFEVINITNLFYRNAVYSNICKYEYVIRICVTDVFFILQHICYITILLHSLKIDMVFRNCTFTGLFK